MWHSCVGLHTIFQISHKHNGDETLPKISNTSATHRTPQSLHFLNYPGCVPPCASEKFEIVNKEGYDWLPERECFYRTKAVSQWQPCEWKFSACDNCMGLYQQYCILHKILPLYFLGVLFENICYIPEAVSCLKLLLSSHSPWSPNFDPRPVDVGFMVNIVSEENVYHRILPFSPVSIIPSVPPTLPFIHSQCCRILSFDVHEN